MKIKTIVEQDVTPPVYLDYNGEVDCIKSTGEMLSVNPGKLITRAEYISRLIKENTGQPLTTQDLDDLRALIDPQQAFKVGDQVVLGEFEDSKNVSWPFEYLGFSLDKREYVGTIALVENRWSDATFCLKLHDGHFAWWHPSGMKRWTPRPPKVGDLVRTDDFKNGTEGMKRLNFVNEFSGKIAVVDGICSTGKPAVHGWYWPVSAVTIIKPAP